MGLLDALQGAAVHGIRDAFRTPADMNPAALSYLMNMKDYIEEVTPTKPALPPAIPKPQLDALSGFDKLVKDPTTGGIDAGAQTKINQQALDTIQDILKDYYTSRFTGQLQQVATMIPLRDLQDQDTIKTHIKKLIQNLDAKPILGSLRDEDTPVILEFTRLIEDMYSTRIDILRKSVKDSLKGAGIPVGGGWLSGGRRKTGGRRRRTARRRVAKSHRLISRRLKRASI
jgi:hypothetical protein